MTRALSLVRLHFSTVLRAVASEAEPKVRNGAAPVTADPALLYARFRAVAPDLRPLVAEVESRSHLADYTVILADCQHSYFALRESLIRPGLQAQLSAYNRAPTLLDAVRLDVLFWYRLANHCAG